MEQALFLPDYGTLPPSFSDFSTWTNPGELLWRDGVVPLLRLCGIPEREITPKASDFEHFRAICRAYPLLSGHPLCQELDALWQSIFAEHISLAGDPDILWRMAVEELLRVPHAREAHLPLTPWNCLVTTRTPPRLPKGALPMPDGAMLLETDAECYTAWREEIQTLIGDFAANGCRQVLLQLPSHLSFAPPAIYHIDRALAARKPSPEQTALLWIQLFRELCEACCLQHLALYVSFAGTSDAAIALLTYANQTVGLPSLFWSAVSYATVDAVLRWQGSTPGLDMRLCITLANAPSAEELAGEIRRCAARFPIDRLCFVTGRDALLLPHAQKRTLEIFQTARKNL